MAFVRTIQENVEGFAKKEIATAKFACESQLMIDHPSERDFKSILINNMIQNFPVSFTGTTNAHTVFGTNLAATSV